MYIAIHSRFSIYAPIGLHAENQVENESEIREKDV